MNSQLKQIGNAVPPLLAYAVAQEVRRALID
jgi:site-specific DNA-cytosine methylase